MISIALLLSCIYHPSRKFHLFQFCLSPQRVRITPTRRHKYLSRREALIEVRHELVGIPASDRRQFSLKVERLVEVLKSNRQLVKVELSTLTSKQQLQEYPLEVTFRKDLLREVGVARVEDVPVPSRIVTREQVNGQLQEKAKPVEVEVAVPVKVVRDVDLEDEEVVIEIVQVRFSSRPL